MKGRGYIGKNYTGASVGGLEYSGSSYLTTGNSVIQDEKWNQYGVKNIFVVTTPRSDGIKALVTEDDGSYYTSSYQLTANGSSTWRWITNYSESGGVSAYAPHPKPANAEFDRFEDGKL